MIQQNGFALQHWTSLAQIIIISSKKIINLRKKQNYLLWLICSADQTAVFFDMPGTSPVNKAGEKSIPIRAMGNEKARIIVILAVLSDECKLPFI